MSDSGHFMVAGKGVAASCRPVPPPSSDAYLYCAHGRVCARPMARQAAACQGATYPSAGSTRLRARPDTAAGSR